MPVIDGITDFLYLHMKDKLRDKEFMRLISSYRSHVTMYNHMNEASKDFLVAVRDKKPIGEIWGEAAKVAIWVARIADLYEKEADKLEGQT